MKIQNEKLNKRIKEITCYDMDEDIDIEEVLDELVFTIDKLKNMYKELELDLELNYIHRPICDYEEE